MTGLLLRWVRGPRNDAGSVVEGAARRWVRHADASVKQRAERLFWQWAVHVGVVLFVAWWLQARGLWRMLVEGDPSGISLGIAALALLVTLWCGHRARLLARQASPGSAWRRAHAAERLQDATLCAQLLADRTHGPHETAWWFCGATLKLGLLGTVVGFIVMASQIGQTASFELDQIQTLLKQMTTGMAIALYTTLVGLIGNLWLGLQLMLLDRLADRLAADVLAEVLGGAAATPGTGH
ncbi:MAG: MotA/TolQ/ExbB proton channel family protein [Rubrivivax sp.]|nr:MotA/TolQ/ExbB proton channel family protein [Rubrivivax sp.]